MADNPEDDARDDARNDDRDDKKDLPRKTTPEEKETACPGVKRV